MSLALDETQQAAVRDAVATDRPVTRLHGYAGTGKTSAVATAVIAELVAEGRTVQVLAPTGKAAKVLRARGIHGAATVHSYLYTPAKRETKVWRERWDDFFMDAAAKTPRAAAALMEIDDATGATDLRDAWAQVLGATKGKAHDAARRMHDMQRFELAFTEGGAIAHYAETGSPAADVLLIDEASMVSMGMSEDLRATGSRLIFVGDPAQLAPVRGQFSRDALGRPHHMFTKVYRQAEGSNVLELATRVREAAVPEVGHTKRKHLLRLDEYDQILCWRNVTRDRANFEIRRALGRKASTIPERDDLLVSLKNTKAPRDEAGKQWMNGEQARVLEVDDSPVGDDMLRLLVRDDEGAEHEVDTPIASMGGHLAEKSYLDKNGWATANPVFAFGYALTVHKAQGSEWERVLLIDESADMYAMTKRREGEAMASETVRQWLYTGITRAQRVLHAVESLAKVPGVI